MLFGKLTGLSPSLNRYTIADNELGGAAITEGVLFLAGAAKSAGSAASSIGRRLFSVFRRSDAFHYTFSKYVSSITTNGLRQGTYATNTGALSPLQAQIELALPANRGLPNALLRVDLAGLRAAGYKVPSFSRVTSSYGLPGGGYELRFPYPIPPQFISVVRQ